MRSFPCPPRANGARPERGAPPPGGARWGRAALPLVAALLFGAGSCTGEAVRPDGTCATNGDCATGELCVAGECVGGTSGGCKEDAQCPLGQVCDPQMRQCVERPVIVCAGDDECPIDQRCNTLTGVCIDGRRSCANGGACPGNLYCDPASQQCVACITQSHCAMPLVCAQGTCVDPEDKPPDGQCTLDTQCSPPATVCETGMCALGCGQPGGLMCTGDEVCDSSNSGRCVTLEGPCRTDGDCTPPATVCELGQCVPGCAEFGGVQCSGGMACNPATGRCGMGGPVCLSDRDCNVPQEICNLFSGTCEAGCLSTGCTAPATCNSTTGHCGGNMPCNPDRHEPNDTPAAAAAITLGPQSGLTLCPNDQDNFRLTLGVGDNLTLTLTFMHGEGDLALELLNPQGQVVGMSNNQTGTETVSYTAPSAGNYVVRVTMVADLGPNPGNTYTLQVNAQIPQCATDAFEDNDSDGNAALILPGTYNNVNVCTGDDDYYDVILTSGQTLRVDLTFSHAEGNIDVGILGILGIPLATATSNTDNETVSYTAQNFGFFTVRVTLVSDSGSVIGNPYSMNVTVNSAPPPGSCMADAFEPNNSSAAATQLAVGNHTGLTSCTGDDDFYRINLTAGQQLTTNLTFVDAEGDIDVELLSPAGAVVAQATTNTDNETLTYTAPSAGAYTLRVTLYGDGGTNPGNTYSMNIATTGGGAAMCPVDMFEPNNSQAAAPLVTPGSYPNLGACPGDDDFYGVNLTAGAPVTIQALFAHAEGDIDMTLLDAAGVVVASSGSTTNDESMTYTPTQTGRFTARVWLYGDLGTVPGNTYVLNISQ